MARAWSPAALAALNLFGFGALGYLALGQRQKAMWFALGTVVLALFCVGALLPVLAAVDVYRLGQRQRAAITSLSFMGFGGIVENLFNVTL